MKLITKLSVVVVVCVVVSGWVAARGDFPEMVRRIPKDVNAVMYMDVERLLASPLAVKEDWKGKRAADFANRPMALPPSVTKLVRAASINLDVDETAWQIAVLEGKSFPSLETIAKKEKGHVDTVANTKAVWSPRGAYAYRISNNSVGLMFPANRQFLARWIKEKPGQYSSYLFDASKDVAAGPQLVMAIDLEDLVQPQLIRERMKQMASLKDSKVNADELARTLISIKGVKFAVAVRDKATGKVTVDFSGDTASLKDVGKPLLLEVLENRGLALEDMDAWKASTTKTSFVLEGDLSTSSLMRLSSLLELPSLPLDESAETEVDASDPKLYATQNHFKSVVALLNDLNAKKKEFSNPAHAAGWWETYATRISRLSVLNVDEEMQEYSAQVADLMRQVVQEGKGAGIRTGVRQSQDNAYSTGYGHGTYDYWGNRDNQARRSAIRSEETGKAATTGTEIRKQIQELTEATRRKMTARYNVEF